MQMKSLEMENSTQNGEAGKSVPSSVADAVLKVSAPVADDARKVRGIEFDDFRGKDITVEELVAGMGGMGFQASAVADAVRIINEMVGTKLSYIQCSHRKTEANPSHSASPTAATLRKYLRLPYFLVIPRILFRLVCAKRFDIWCSTSMYRLLSRQQVVWKKISLNALLRRILAPSLPKAQSYARKV